MSNALNSPKVAKRDKDTEQQPRDKERKGSKNETIGHGKTNEVVSLLRREGYMLTLKDFGHSKRSQLSLKHDAQ